MRISKSLHKQVLLTSLVFASTQIVAMDLGVIGNTYQIAEQDAVEQIKEKLVKMQQTGELQKIEQESIKKSINSLKNPKSNDSLIVATKKSSKLYDPTQTFNEEVRAEDGTLISPAGRKVNPLDYVKLSKTMVFFDGRDKEQVEAVKKLISKEGLKVKPILTGGSWFDISKEWKKQVYFDQGAYLTKRLTIEEVPAIVSQVGNKLQINYVPAKEIN